MNYRLLITLPLLCLWLSAPPSREAPGVDRLPSAASSCPAPTEMGWAYLEQFLGDPDFAADRMDTQVAGLRLEEVHAVTDASVCARIAEVSPGAPPREASYFQGGGRYFVTHTLPKPPEGRALGDGSVYLEEMYMGLGFLRVLDRDFNVVEGFAW